MCAAWTTTAMAWCRGRSCCTRCMRWTCARRSRWPARRRSRQRRRRSARAPCSAPAPLVSLHCSGQPGARAPCARPHNRRVRRGPRLAACLTSRLWTHAPVGCSRGRLARLLDYAHAALPAPALHAGPIMQLQEVWDANTQRNYQLDPETNLVYQDARPDDWPQVRRCAHDGLRHICLCRAALFPCRPCRSCCWRQRLPPGPGCMDQGRQHGLHVVCAQVVGRRNAAGVLELVSRNEDDGLFSALDTYLKTYK